MDSVAHQSPLVCRQCGQPITPTQLLTAREREVLLRLAQGVRMQDIADALHMAYGTVSRHVWNMRQKLGLPSQAMLIAYAWQMGLASRS